MGKYNKPKPERRQEEIFKRFCPNCHKVTYYFKCSCGTPTRRLRMEQTIQSIYQSTNKRRKQTMSDLRQLLNDSSLKEFTYDEQSFENKIDYAVDEVIKVFRRWLSGKLVAGSEKANPHNDVILKLLAEIKDGERVKQ